MIKFKGYVFGQYVVYSDFNAEISKQYLQPEVSGLIESLPVDELNEYELNKYEKIKHHFDILFLKDQKIAKLTLNEIKARLKKSYAITLPPDTPYNDAAALLAKHNEKMVNRYLHIYRNKSAKKLRFTWYLTKKTDESLKLEFRKKLNNLPTAPEQMEERFKRLYQRGHFHRVRHRIGVISAIWKKRLKPNIPIFSKK